MAVVFTPTGGEVFMIVVTDGLSGCCFRPVLIEVPHFASLRGNEREITILRSDNGQTWREHSTVATDDAVQEALEGSFTGQPLYCRVNLLPPPCPSVNTC